MTWFHRLLSRLFKHEEINGHNRCATYLYRWSLLSTPWFKVYLHRFVGDDWSRDLHDHPKQFTSIGLFGSYIEETPRGETTYRAPWIRTFPPEHVHRLRLNSRECWTLVFVGRYVRPWGFWNVGRWIPWSVYVFGGESHLADQRKDC